MPKFPFQKLKLLYLCRILADETDENHGLTMPEIIERLASHDISAERKSVYEDMESLRTFGMDIAFENKKGYFLTNRDFEIPELKLLVDAVQSAKFITAKKSADLIKKIETLASRHGAGLLHRQVFIADRVKTDNKYVYYNVDAIHDAINTNKKITFKYFDFNISKERVYRNDGQLYSVSPLSLTVDGENYYLVAHSDKRDKLAHFRVDKMSGISVTDDFRTSIDGFNIASYTKKMFGMFSGEDEQVEVIFDNSLTGVVIDRFGMDVKLIKSDENNFKAILNITLSPVFLSWILQFGSRAKITAPKKVADSMKSYIEDLLKMY